MFISKSVKSALVLASVIPVMAQASPWGQTTSAIEWDSADQAIAVGTACRSEAPAPNVFFERLGQQFSVVLGYAGINLTGSVYPMAERHTCTIRVPFTVKRGHYVSGIDLSIPFVASKTALSSGEIAVRAGIVGLPGVTAKAELPFQRAFHNVISSLDVQAAYGATEGSFCSSLADTPAVLAINLATAGQRDTRADSIYASFLEGEEIDLSEALATSPCNR